jgi:tRNA pseudouridine55 synthase
MSVTHGFPRVAPPTDSPNPFDGILLIDKPTEHTSHDVVARVRGHLGMRKVGHGGTLDPMATGLLIILLGRGTKLSDRIMGADKTYEGTITFGSTTDSQDADGEIVSEADPSGVTEEAVTTAMTDMLGDQMQMPPMVSAVKVNGVPLYKHARKGREVERDPRFVHVYKFVPTAFNLPSADFIVSTTKGTYVRTLCHDLGQTLGCGAHLSRLRRTRSGKLDVANAITLDELLATPLDQVNARVMPIQAFR